MKLAPVFVIEEYEQLKTVSDPFRTKILSHLIEKAYTGQQLAQLLELARSKIHYHLAELERNGFIQVVKTEVKNGIIQKFYRAVAWSFVPGDRLLPHRSEVEDYFREYTLNALNRARLRALSAPEEAFQVPSSERASWPRITMQMEVRVPPERFAEWLGRYRSLLSELDRMGEEELPDSKLFYMATVGFQFEEPWFEGDGPEDAPREVGPEKADREDSPEDADRES
ncbi:MAG: putative transcriptional regulator [Paenibacillaceae bacterium]|nr:putative transcriptional regulator [Paenibacillaceae bacterium]